MQLGAAQTKWEAVLHAHNQSACHCVIKTRYICIRRYTRHWPSCPFASAALISSSALNHRISYANVSQLAVVNDCVHVNTRSISKSLSCFRFLTQTTHAQSMN